MAGFFFGLHRLALWMERRGWLYYIHRKPSSSALSCAALEIQKYLEPDRENLVEEMRRDETRQNPSGDSP